MREEERGRERVASGAPVCETSRVRGEGLGLHRSLRGSHLGPMAEGRRNLTLRYRIIWRSTAISPDLGFTV